ncbi:MAG: TIGR04282 family arsenosugar biosynthesis glycosyltransferase [Phycisphaerales bacterium]|nr:TIGR04282 family arsenosugar biosynthesis glycosyltransferase [Phycisphaerales bacterium]
MKFEIQNNFAALLFAKYPTPGAVMTRLCPPLSPEEAVRIQRACMQHIWSELTVGDWCCPVLVGSPDDALADFPTILDPDTADGSRMCCWPQGDGDLGERLVRASKLAFDCGARAVVFLGVDSPMQDWDVIRGLSGLLASADVAIGPCADGGYYFLATRRHIPELFAGVDWGTSRVFEQTLSIAERLKLSVWRAESGYDLDRVEDLHRALGDLEPDCELARTIRDVLAKSDQLTTKDSA